jgi:hypothetical protein
MKLLVLATYTAAAIVFGYSVVKTFIGVVHDLQIKARKDDEDDDEPV